MIKYNKDKLLYQCQQVNGYFQVYFKKGRIRFDGNGVDIREKDYKMLDIHYGKAAYDNIDCYDH